MAPFAEARSHAGRRRDHDARRLPRPRAPELDSELRSLRARAGPRSPRARHRRTVRGSTSEVRMTIRMLAAALAIGAAAAPASAATKAIKAGRLIDASGRAVANAIIVIDNDRIASVGTAAPPAGAEVIDLGRYTVIPGMVDVHTHMTY